MIGRGNLVLVYHLTIHVYGIMAIGQNYDDHHPSENSGIVTLIVSIVCFCIVMAMNIHITKFYTNGLQKRIRLSHVVFIPAIFALSLCCIYLLIQSILIILQLISADEPSQALITSDAAFWMMNDIIHQIGKESMYLFFLARYVNSTI